MREERRDAQLDELLGAYALDAVDGAERLRVDDYIAAHADARTEVDEMRETAAWLALATSDRELAPPEVWDRIAAEIGRPDVATDASTNVVPLLRRADRGRSGVPWRIAAPVAAAAAIAIGLLGVAASDDSGSSRTDLAAAFSSAMAQPDTTEVVLASHGTPMARVALQRDGTGYLIADDALSALGDGRTYQLWAIVDGADGGRPISAGVLGPSVTAAAFHVDRNHISALAISVEPAGGSAAPTEAIADGAVGA